MKMLEIFVAEVLAPFMFVTAAALAALAGIVAVVAGAIKLAVGK